MERKRSKQASVLLWATMAALFSQNLVVTVLSEISFEDQKNFFPIPDPHATTPPAVSYTPPAGGYSPPTPSHGGGTPPAHCGNPPSEGHHHPTHSPPTSSGGGGYYHSPPSSSGGGGYYHSPPTSTPTPTPTTPTIGTPPITITPPTPSITIPSPPLPSPPFTCTYWRNHPTLIWSLLGWWGSVGNAFGVSSLPGVTPHMSLVEALSNTRTDGYGDLYREGTAALLNSMAHTKFPYTTTHVRDSFVAALSSNKAATAQAQLFKLANEGRIKATV